MAIKYRNILIKMLSGLNGRLHAEIFMCNEFQRILDKLDPDLPCYAPERDHSLLLAAGKAMIMATLERHANES